MFFIDAFARRSHVFLLFICNVTFARLLVQIIRLKAQFSNYKIKTIHLNNVGEFTFKTFNGYCTSIDITVEHLVPHVHTQNGLAELTELLIK